MKNLFFFLSLVMIQLTHAQEDLDAYEIMAKARYVSSLSKHDLSGNLKKNGRKVPMKLYMRGKDIQMQYQPSEGQGWQGIHLQLKNDSCDLYDVYGSEMTKFSDEKIGQSIANTDLSFEDVSMRFLYWPSPEIVGEETIMAQGCHIIRVYNPNLLQGNYAVCDLWIHKKAGALMRVKAFDQRAQHIKTFEASDLMNVNGEIMMRKMKVERLKNGRVQSVSYMIFDNPEKRSAKKRVRRLK